MCYEWCTEVSDRRDSETVSGFAGRGFAECFGSEGYSKQKVIMLMGLKTLWVKHFNCDEVNQTL